MMRYRYQQSGFTLIELMISLVVGLVIVGGAFATLLANQQSYRAKQELDHAQESLRFVSHGFSQVVRSSERIQEGSSDKTLILRIPEGSVNCRGFVVSANEDNQLIIGNGSLNCVTPDGSIELINGVNSSSSTFTYASSTGSFSGFTTGNLHNSVRLNLVMDFQEGFTVPQIATVRSAILARQKGMQGEVPPTPIDPAPPENGGTPPTPADPTPPENGGTPPTPTDPAPPENGGTPLGIGDQCPTGPGIFVGNNECIVINNSKASWSNAANSCPSGYRVPTRSELQSIYAMRGQIDSIRSEKYWSSEQQNNNRGHFVDMINGSSGHEPKGNQNYVMCIK